MATYVPNANQTTEPTESKTVESAALELRTLKKHALQFLTADADASKTTLPAATARAGKFLAFDSVTGEPVIGPDIADWTVTQAQIADVETVATNMADVNLVVDNMAALNNLSDAVTNGDLLTDVYQGAHAAAPVLRLDGAVLQTGDLYFNTTNSQMFTYDGASWIDYEAAAVVAQLAAEAAEINAETAQTAAELAETHAETAQNNAETAETGAVAAKVAAEAARIAAELAAFEAQAGAQYYELYSTGLAAVSDGQFFRVLSPDGLSVYTYQKSGATAVLKSIGPVARSTADTARGLSRSGAIATPIPAGAVADFVAVDALYALTIAPNRAAYPYDPFANILNSSRLSSSWIRSLATNSGLTLTWDVAGPDGALEALQIQYDGVGNDWLYALFNIPAGQWTLAMDVKSNSGSSADFRIGVDSTYNTVTATTSFTTVSTTVTRTTAGTYVSFFYAPSVPAALDITIDNVRLVPGSGVGTASAKGATVARQALPLRESLVVKNTRSPANAGAVYNVATDGQKSLSEFTLSMLVRRSSADLTPETNTLFTFDGNTSYSISYPHGTSFVTKFAAPPMVSLPAQKWVVMTFVFRAIGEAAIWVNGCKVAVSSAASTARLLRRVSLLRYASDSDALVGYHGSSVFYERALSDADVLNLFAAMRSRAAVVGESFTDYSCIYIAEGDSITYGRLATVTTDGYAYLMGRKYDPFLQGVNYGIDGSTLGTLESPARFDAAIATIGRAVIAGKLPIMSVLIGTNDASAIPTNIAADAWYVRLVAYWTAMRNAGAKVVAATCLPRNDGVWSEPVRTYLNGLIRADATKYDALVDYAADPTIGVWSGTYWGDAFHPNTAGHAVMADLLDVKIRGLWIP